MSLYGTIYDQAAREWENEPEDREEFITIDDSDIGKEDEDDDDLLS